MKYELLGNNPTIQDKLISFANGNVLSVNANFYKLINDQLYWSDDIFKSKGWKPSNTVITLSMFDENDIYIGIEPEFHKYLTEAHPILCHIPTKVMSRIVEYDKIMEKYFDVNGKMWDVVIPVEPITKHLTFDPKKVIPIFTKINPQPSGDDFREILQLLYDGACFKISDHSDVFKFDKLGLLIYSIEKNEWIVSDKSGLLLNIPNDLIFFLEDDSNWQSVLINQQLLCKVTENDNSFYTIMEKYNPFAITNIDVNNNHWDIATPVTEEELTKMLLSTYV